VGLPSEIRRVFGEGFIETMEQRLSSKNKATAMRILTGYLLKRLEKACEIFARSATNPHTEVQILAVRKFSPFPVLKQPKFPVDETLYKLNLVFPSPSSNYYRLSPASRS